MKKILLSLLTILLTIILILCMKNGISIGPLQILGFQGLADKNQELKSKIEEANQKSSEYTKKVENIQKDTEALAKAKKSYLDLVTVSTDSEIQNALQTKTYTIEYLWSQVGNHATKNGVVTKMEVMPSSLGDSDYKNLNFTATGNYLAITSFITELENDSDLQFTIDNFTMKSKSATFVVKNIRVLKENTTAKTTRTNTTSENDASNKTTDNESEKTEKMTNAVANTFAPRYSENQTY